MDRKETVDPRETVDHSQAEKMGEQTDSILVVDDNPVTRVLCSRVLAREGYRVLVAEDGIEALRLVKEDKVDLVLLDVMMPGLDGFDVLVALRKVFPSDTLRVLMVTAKDKSQEVVRAFELGADDYILKPLDIPVMLVRIQAQLRARPKRREMDTSSLQVAPGAVLEGKYRLESPIGQGSFGAVYRATHLALERAVAIKVFHHGLKTGAETSRFQHEAISACRVDHPNAVKVLDLSLAGSGVPFMVMELLEGRSLAAELELEGRLSLSRCLEILTPICKVLSEVHGVGLIHRDIKPQNVFLHRGRQGEVVKVLDFGIAKLIDGAAMQTRQTVNGIVGTPVYMAPERFSDEVSSQRSDIYSLGVMLYEMLAGRRPFESTGDIFKLIVMHMNEMPISLCELRPELPSAIDQVVMAALAKKSTERPTAGELAHQFTEALSHEEPLAESPRG